MRAIFMDMAPSPHIAGCSGVVGGRRHSRLLANRASRPIAERIEVLDRDVAADAQAGPAVRHGGASSSQSPPELPGAACRRRRSPGRATRPQPAIAHAGVAGARTGNREQQAAAYRGGTAARISHRSSRSRPASPRKSTPTRSASERTTARSWEMNSMARRCSRRSRRSSSMMLA